MQLTDVTLREGAQLPGRSYDVEQKVSAGEVLGRLDLPYIQAGFPATGEVDREATRRLADDLEADLIGLARAVPGDVEAALDANVDVVEVFAPLSDGQLEYVVDSSRAEMFEALREAIDLALEGGADVHLSLLDAFRTDPEYLVTAFDRFSEVSYVNLPDTVGSASPSSVQQFLERLGEEHNIDLSRVGVHFHDDLGVATANTITAFQAGVGKADVSVGGLGERAGNAPLEEVVAIGDLEHDTSFGVGTADLVPACKRVLTILEEDIPDQKALLGRETTRHESGIHTAAMIEEPSVFEPFDPSRFGSRRKLIFGEGTGRGGARRLLERADVAVEGTDDAVSTVLELLADEGPLETEAAVRLIERRLGA
ncbi:2-isopropylmalate synthase/methanogen homocitrate synthase [Halobiforma haloterrestris]|uniref:2-isopropylmalate synthase/methanogen homocitrate synthase n=1 Tax=Natronobacterium haloterrestre TaxID=148448 RepID=A0A1I1L8D0_NATHA|nr:LeuA family protein [Halobiforma haloterrestris]SFC69215.1 2-isopropylmalate synthase/methanogen homocitrate synthase [Halobiforma haloterrestris]